MRRALAEGRESARRLRLDMTGLADRNVRQFSSDCSVQISSVGQGGKIFERRKEAKSMKKFDCGEFFFAEPENRHGRG